jgi:hypothetical protein
MILYVGMGEEITSGGIKKSTLFNNTELQQMKRFNILHAVLNVGNNTGKYHVDICQCRGK